MNIQPIKTLKFVSEITGSGKTNNLLNKIAKSNGKYILAFPTRELCDEVYQFLLGRGVIDGVNVIHGTTSETPSKEISNVVSRQCSTRVMITTHASLRMCIQDSMLSEKRNWSLVIDEEMPFYVNHEFNVSEHSCGILDSLVDVQEYDEHFFLMVKKDAKLWSDVVNGYCEDSFMDHPKLVAILRYADSEQYDTLIPKDVWYRYLEARGSLKNGEFKKLYATSILNKSFFNGFKEITVLCSFFEKTISYRMAKWAGVPLEKIKLGLNARHHSNSELITINYYTQVNWTQTFKKKEIPDLNGGTITVENFIKNKILSELANKKFIYASNKNLRGRDNFGSGELVTSIHGVNRYTDYTNMVYMQSLNATGSEVNLLSYFGITRPQIDFARTVLGAYQFVSRGAVRKQNNNERINLYITDKRTVDFLLTVFPNAEVIYHGVDILYVKEEIKEENNEKKRNVPPAIRAFVSRTRKKIREGKTVRVSTLARLKKIMAEYDYE